jgi:hypothetical protein
MKNNQSSLEYSRLAWEIETNTANEKLVLVFLAAKADKNGVSWHGYASIRKQTKLSPSTITRAKAYLRDELGVLTWESGFKTQYGKKTNHYSLSLPRMKELAAIAKAEQSQENPANSDAQPAVVDAQTKVAAVQHEQGPLLPVSNDDASCEQLTDQRTDQLELTNYKTDHYRTRPQEKMRSDVFGFADLRASSFKDSKPASVQISATTHDMVHTQETGIKSSPTSCEAPPPDVAGTLPPVIVKCGADPTFTDRATGKLLTFLEAKQLMSERGFEL